MEIFYSAGAKLEDQQGNVEIDILYNNSTKLSGIHGKTGRDAVTTKRKKERMKEEKKKKEAMK